MALNIQECTKSARRPHPSKFFKGCLPQILTSPSLNTLSQICHLEFSVLETILKLKTQPKSWPICGDSLQKQSSGSIL